MNDLSHENVREFFKGVLDRRRKNTECARGNASQSNPAVVLASDSMCSKLTEGKDCIINVNILASIARKQ